MDVLGTVRNSPKQPYSGARLKRMLYAHAISVQGAQALFSEDLLVIVSGLKGKVMKRAVLARFAFTIFDQLLPLRYGPHPHPILSMLKETPKIPQKSKYEDLIFEFKCRARDMDLVMTLLNILINHFSCMTLI